MTMPLIASPLRGGSTSIVFLDDYPFIKPGDIMPTLESQGALCRNLSSSIEGIKSSLDIAYARKDTTLINSLEKVLDALEEIHSDESSELMELL